MNTKIETLIDELCAAIVKSPCMLPDEVVAPINNLIAALRAQADQQAQPQAIPTKQMLWAGTEAFREIVNGAEVDNPALHIFERMIAASQKERGK